MFARAENVGQLFDALWYHAALVVRDGDFPVDLQRHREKAIAAAHRRYQELS